MMEVHIKDGVNNGQNLQVDELGNAYTITNQFPPRIIKTQGKIFRSYMKDSAASSDMKVVATAAAPHDFYISGSTIADRYITSVSFVIADAGATLTEFGAVAALANGCKMFYEDESQGDVVIHEGLTSNWDFVRLSQGNPAFGTAADVFRAKNVLGISDAYTPVLDFRKIFGLTYGIQIAAGSTNRLIVRIQDTTSGVDAFNAIAYGFDRLV